MNIIEKNLNKYEKLTKGKKPPIEIQLRNKHDEAVNKRIQNLIPTKNVSELNSIINQISETTGYSNNRVYEAIMKADSRHILLDQIKGTVYVKRNII